MQATILFIVASIGVATASYPAVGSAAYNNDNNVLQYALTLELLEANFYTSGLQRFNQSDFDAAGYTGSTYGFIEIIRDHEIAHAAALTQLLQTRGQVPTTACGYNFGYSSVTEFLATALVLEETGVSAYDGASISITQDDLRVLASSVASVEARHAAYLNIVNGKQPFYNATDMPRFKPMIIAMASQFLNGSCPSTANVTAATLYNSSNLVPLDSIQNSTQSAAAYNNDNNVIQFALTQEHLEVAFFTAALDVITAQTFQLATNLSTTRDYFEIILQHEISHAATLKSLIQARGQTPVGNCTQYLFNFTNSVQGVFDFIQLSAQLEIIGVEAFIGASQLVTDPSLLLLGATVLTVEARHVAYERYILSQITGDNVTYVPFPNFTDPTAPPAQLRQMQGNFVNLASCPNVTLPVPAITFQSNSTNGSNSTVPSTNATSNGTDMCDGQTYDVDAYVCVDNQIGGNQLCPIDASNACGTACYDSGEYCCDVNGSSATLIQAGSCGNNGNTTNNTGSTSGTSVSGTITTSVTVSVSNTVTGDRRRQGVDVDPNYSSSTIVVGSIALIFSTLAVAM